MKERKQTNRMADIMPVLTLIYAPPPFLSTLLHSPLRYVYVAALCGPWPLAGQ